MTVLVIDYGASNLTSLSNALKHLAVPHTVSSDPADLASARLALLPGVGSFGAGMKGLVNRGLVTAIRDFAQQPGCRLFGICLGMQLLFEGSEEAPDQEGLGLLPGIIMKLTPQPGAPVPHVGFDAIYFDRPSPLVADISNGADFYFVHSFALPQTSNGCWTARCAHSNTEFVAAVANANVAGVQFHPEKSQINGLTLLRNATSSADWMEIAGP